MELPDGRLVIINRAPWWAGLCAVLNTIMLSGFAFYAGLVVGNEIINPLFR